MFDNGHNITFVIVIKANLHQFKNMLAHKGTKSIYIVNV